MTCLAAWLSPTGAACHRGALHARTAEGGPRTEGKEPRTTTLGCWPWQRPMAKFSASASSDRSALQLGYHPSNHGHPSPASRLDSQNDVRHAQLLPEAVRLDAVDAVNVTGIVLHNVEFELSKLIPCSHNVSRAGMAWPTRGNANAIASTSRSTGLAARWICTAATVLRK